MDGDRFLMTPSRELNPLRPYYIPPSVGPTSNTTQHQTPPLVKPLSADAGPSLSNTARELLPDIDLDLKTTTSEAWQHTRSLFDTLAWRYTSVLLAQPFDVAKNILQSSAPPSTATSATPRTTRSTRNYTSSDSGRRALSGDGYRADDSDEDLDNESDVSDDVVDYFSATAPRSRSPRKRRRAPVKPEISPSPTPLSRSQRESRLLHDGKLVLKQHDAILHAISALYTSSGTVGLWRASNTTFLYAILLRSTDSFLRSLLLAILGLPDIPGPDQGGLAPGLSSAGGAGFSGINLSESPNPITSLFVVGLASCITGLLLSPLDLVRTRLIVTPMSHPPRGLVSNLRRLPSLVTPSQLWLPTALFHSIPSLFSAASSLILRNHLRITPDLSPGLWSLAAFTTSLTELFIRLPLETLVRRAQVTSLQQSDPNLPFVIDPAPYVGVWGTIHSICFVEGETVTRSASGFIRRRHGQGIAGLVRGWRVGFWGLVGVWGAGALGSSDVKGRGEF